MNKEEIALVKEYKQMVANKILLQHKINTKILEGRWKLIQKTKPISMPSWWHKRYRKSEQDRS